MNRLSIALILVFSCFASQAMSFDENSHYSDSIKIYDLIHWQKTDARSRAAAKARAKYGGKVLSVKEIKKDGKPSYRVKLLLKDGRVKVVRI